LVQTADGGYALAGITSSFGAGGGDFWLVKTDANGTMQWNQTYGGAITDYASALVQTADGGYALAGFTGSFGAGNHDFWLVKTDSAGNALWNKTYGGTSVDEAYALVQTADGGYALAGYTWSYGAGGSDSWLVKTDANGTAQWNMTYGGTGIDYALALVQTADGGYALAGFTGSFGAGYYDFWLVKTDANGTAQWNMTYGGTSFDWAEDLVQTADGGYALAGSTYSYGAGMIDFWLVRTDSAGNALWNMTYGGTGDDYAYDSVQTVDGGYALAGVTGSYGAGGSDFWLVKTDAYGNDLGGEYGLVWVDSATNTITLHKGEEDPLWNYVRVRILRQK
jgi:predicted secreted protein